MTTSKAWTVSNGTLGSRPASASCSACRLTQDTHLIDTLKLRSLPSPGMVTSSSTWVGDVKEKIKRTEAALCYPRLNTFGHRCMHFALHAVYIPCLGL